MPSFRHTHRHIVLMLWFGRVFYVSWNFHLFWMYLHVCSVLATLILITLHCSNQSVDGWTIKCCCRSVFIFFRLWLWHDNHESNRFKIQKCISMKTNRKHEHDRSELGGCLKADCIGNLAKCMNLILNIISRPIFIPMKTI